MLKIRVGDLKIGDRERRIINEVLDSGRVSEAGKVKQFEESWAKFIGSRYCVAVNSGTSALIAALYALKVRYKLKDKAKVITSPLTFIATVNSIVAAGFEPVFVDIDRRTFVITPENIETALKKTKAAIILPVHLMGYPADMEKIIDLGRRYKTLVMEDAAQAHGTLYKGKMLGSFGLLGCFSFYIAHNVQAGEMGAVVTDDAELNKLLRKIKAHGRMCDCAVCERAHGTCPRFTTAASDEDLDPRFHHEMFGFNFKAMEFQAALGIVQLEGVDDIIKKRLFNVEYLNKGLEAVSRVVQLPVYSPDISYLAYPLVIKEPAVITRKVLRQRLEEAGIETRPLFGCIPTQQPAYARLKELYSGKLPNAEYIGSNGFYIGCHQYLTRADLDFIIETFRRILKDYKV